MDRTGRYTLMALAALTQALPQPAPRLAHRWIITRGIDLTFVIGSALAGYAGCGSHAGQTFVNLIEQAVEVLPNAGGAMPKMRWTPRLRQSVNPLFAVR